MGESYPLGGGEAEEARAVSAVALHLLVAGLHVVQVCGAGGGQLRLLLLQTRPGRAVVGLGVVDGARPATKQKASDLWFEVGPALCRP